MIEIILYTLLALYGIGYVVFFMAALLDSSITKSAKFIGTLFLISLVWPIAFTMYVLDRD